MVDQWQVQKTIRSHLLNGGVTGLPDSDHQSWENVSFSPTQGEPWIREAFLPSEEQLSANEEHRAVGIVQFDYFIPLEYPISDAKSVAHDIKTLFQPPLVIDNFVHIDQSQLLNGSPSDSWYQLPIQINWRAYSYT